MTATVTPPNKFYCLGNEDGEFRTNQHIGLISFREKAKPFGLNLGFGTTSYLEREEVEAMSIEQKLLYFFHLIDCQFQVIDTFINVESKDICFAQLAFENSKFFLVDSKATEKRIGEIVGALSSYNTNVALATPEQLPQALSDFENAKEILYDELVNLCGVNS